MINLYSPEVTGLSVALILSYLLGIVHGITPDEHTWPITFSYSVGSYSTRGGAKAGMLFSLGFTVQRAALSEVAYFALASVFMSNMVDGITYMVVGGVMAASGLYIRNRLRYPHFHAVERYLESLAHIHGGEKSRREMQHTENPVGAEGFRGVPLRLTFVHGLIAGFGFGAFALIIYTTLAPSMPSPYLGFVPGALFGLGTMTMQVLFGTLFGAYMRRLRIGEEGIKYVARGVSSSVLYYGGLVFLSAGALVLVVPGILDLAIVTPIMVHNLHSLGLGFFLVVATVAVIGALSLRVYIRRAKSRYGPGRDVAPAKAPGDAVMK